MVFGFICKHVPYNDIFTLYLLSILTSSTIKSWIVKEKKTAALITQHLHVSRDERLPCRMRQDYAIASSIANHNFYIEHKSHADSNVQIFISYRCQCESPFQNIKYMTKCWRWVRRCAVKERTIKKNKEVEKMYNIYQKRVNEILYNWTQTYYPSHISPSVWIET